jgi:RES domain-containing protein
MPVVWRLAPPTYAAVLDGEGNRVTGARWNSPGRGVVYASANLSLCVLETYAHIPPALRLSIPEFRAVRMSAPDDAGVTQVTVSELEGILTSSNPEDSFRNIGDRWLRDAAHLLLIAPSVIVPEELNVMLNPAHPRMRDVRIESTRPFRFDPRLSASR